MQIASVAFATFERDKTRVEYLTSDNISNKVGSNWLATSEQYELLINDQHTQLIWPYD